MSLITRCPACRTMFKVVPDQLRISQGWVRCGKCQEVFDASADLHEGSAQENLAVADDGPDTLALDEAPADAVATDAAAQPVPALTPPAPPQDEPAQAASSAPDFELTMPPAVAAAVAEPARPSRSMPLESAAADAPAAAKPRRKASRREPPPPAPAPESAEPAVEPSFMRAARQSSRWHRPLVRATLMVLCLLLSGGLALQVLVHERDRVAAIEPSLKPLLEDVCLLLDCRVGPLRKIESVLIDSSAFSKTKGDVYRLSLTLRNSAPVDLAMPAVELALTDTLDQPVLRRVLLPEELGVRSGVIPVASEIQTTLVLSIKANGNGERIAGYRLLAFYP